MCSIMGFCGSGVTFARFKECFDRTVSRGPDDTRYVDTGAACSASTGLRSWVCIRRECSRSSCTAATPVCNGEIYGFEKLREELITKGYKFQSRVRL